MRNRTGLRALTAALTALLAAFAISACGDSGSTGTATAGSDTTATGTKTTSAGKNGGTITILGTSFPDYLDPALSYTVDGWEALTQVYPGLLVFPHQSGAPSGKPVPGLATALPVISNGGKTYKLTLRKDLIFSNGTPIKASDFKASIERIAAADSQGVGLGYTNIVGAEEYLKTKKGGITGIVVDDATGDITINLVKPRGAFTYELAIPFAGIVPKSTPAKNQTKSPPPGAGRYVIKNVEVGRSYTLVKNPNFSPSLVGTAVDAGKLDTINVKIVSSVDNQVTQLSQNKADFMIDNPNPDRIGDVKAKYGGKRFRLFPTPSSFYFFMNTEAPPFDKLKVRQAVNYALDINAINRVQGGVLSPAHTILPKGIPGYADSKTLYPYNLAKAKALIKEAGATGAKVTVWANPENPTKPTMEYYADVLNKIGMNATVKVVPAETYFTTIGDRSVKAQTGWANWFQDYPHPSDFIDVLLNPSKVVATGNNNYSYNASDKELAAKINTLNTKQITPETEKEWAAVDREIQEKAYWAMYGNREQGTFFSDRMDFENCKGDDWLPANHDWAQFCLK